MPLWEDAVWEGVVEWFSLPTRAHSSFHLSRGSGQSSLETSDVSLCFGGARRLLEGKDGKYGDSFESYGFQRGFLGKSPEKPGELGDKLFAKGILKLFYLQWTISAQAAFREWEKLSESMRPQVKVGSTKGVKLGRSGRSSVEVGCS